MSGLLMLLAWRPFLDPLGWHAHWPWLLPPLVLAIAAVYKALHLPALDRFWPETLRLSATILTLMLAAAAVLWIVVGAVV